MSDDEGFRFCRRYIAPLLLGAAVVAVLVYAGFYVIPNDHIARVYYCGEGLDGYDCIRRRSP